MNLKYRPIHIVEPTPCSHIRTINDSCASEEQQWRNWGKLPGSRRITQRYILIRWSKNTFLYTDLKIHCAFRPMILTKDRVAIRPLLWSKFWHKRGNLWQPWGVIVQELCESRGGRPELSVLTSLLVSVDVRIYWTVLRHWSQLVPNMSNDIWGH